MSCNDIDNKLNVIKNFMMGKSSSDLIEVLHKVQALYGYIPREIVSEISKALNLPISKIYGVITFYSAFSTEPKGDYQINVCMGTACYVKNAEDILNEFSKILGIKMGETTDDLLFSLVETRCVGECADAPVVSINDKIYSKVVVDDVKDILAEINADNK